MESKQNDSRSKQDAADLRMMKKMKKAADEGYDVEFKSAGKGSYKMLRYKKHIMTA